MLNVSLDEAVLFFWGWIALRAAGERDELVAVVIAPFGEVVSEFETGKIGIGVFKVDDDKLFMLVGGLEERGVTGRLKAEDVAVLSLGGAVRCFSSRVEEWRTLTSLCANTNFCFNLSHPPYCSSNHVLYFSTVFRK